MGFWSALGLATAAPLATASTTDFASPLTPEDMSPEIAAAFGMSAFGEDRVTRREAMSIPAMRRGRTVIAGTLGTMPLIALRDNTERVERPLLLQPDPDTTLQWMLTWTVDDLIFSGISWWQVTARDSTGYPISARRALPGTVSVAGGEVRIDGYLVNNADVIRFDGPDEGVLAAGRSLRTCLMLEEAVRRFARLDVPLGVLEQAEGAPNLADPEIDKLLDSWERYRQQRTTAYLNKALRYTPVVFDAQRIQLAEGRQYQNSEIARLLNLPGRYVGAGEGDSMTYSNAESARRDLVDLSLAPWITAIQQRLSMPDVTPRGQTVRLDTSGFVRGDTSTAMNAAKVAIDAGVLTPAEVRADLYSRPPLTEETP